MSKLLDSLGRRHDLSSIFNDFVTMSICSYHRTNIHSRLREKDPVNEQLYFDTIDKYDDTEVKTFPQALAEAQMHIYERPYSDPFGDYYMEHISNGRNGEYFTPEPVCEMVALMQDEQGSIENRTAHDPACGSGRMLLAFAKLNPDNYFYGSDLSNSCAKMATVNFFLNGLRGEVAWMNALSMEWFGGWQINTIGLGIAPINKEQSRIWSASPPKPEPPPLPSNDPDHKTTERGVQLDLF